MGLQEVVNQLDAKDKTMRDMAANQVQTLQLVAGMNQALIEDKSDIAVIKQHVDAMWSVIEKYNSVIEKFEDVNTRLEGIRTDLTPLFVQYGIYDEHGNKIVNEDE